MRSSLKQEKRRKSIFVPWRGTFFYFGGLSCHGGARRRIIVWVIVYIKDFGGKFLVITHTAEIDENTRAGKQAMVNTNKPSNLNDVPNHDPIAAALKQMHDAVADEALPDDFLRLLDEIDMKIASKKASG